MFSERIGAAEALSLGLVNRIAADAELDAVTDAFASRLAQGPTLAWRAIKENVQRALTHTAETALDMEAANMIRCRLSEDCIDAMKAFQEKREPVFKGR